LYLQPENSSIKITLKMVITELDTFLQKFSQLWHAGHRAHLDLETHAGRAWVGLCVQLGHAPGYLHQQPPPPPPFPQFHKKKESPSCQRRRTRRAAARKPRLKKQWTNKLMKILLPMMKMLNKQMKQNTTVKVGVIEAEQVLKENADNFHESSAATVQVAEEKEAEKVLTENVVKPGVEEIVVEEISDKVWNDEEYLEGSQKSKELDGVVIVHAVASFENSPSDNLNQEDVNSLEKYIFSEEHLTNPIS
jgi:hypothetical protein